MIVVMPQTCFWNAVDRAVVTFTGAEIFAMSGMLVCDGLQATAVLPVSLNVICFQRVPPHWGPGDCTWASAGAANAATQAASAAAAVREKRILGPPEVGSRKPQRTGLWIGRRTAVQHARRSYPSRGSSTPRTLSRTIRPMPAIQRA